MHTNLSNLSCFSRALSCFTTALLVCLAIIACGPVGGAEEQAEQLFTDDQWNEASARSSIAAPGVDARSANQEGGQVQSSMLRMVAGLVVVIALALLIAWLLRRSGLHRRLPGQRGEHLEVLESLSLGPKRGVSLLRVGEQCVLVGHNEQHMAALGTFADLPGVSASVGHSETKVKDQTVTSQSSTPRQDAPQARVVVEGDSFEATSSPREIHQAELKGPSQTDSVDDFRQRLNRLLGGRS